MVSFWPNEIDEFADLVKDKLFNRRLFISACNIANERLARSVIPQSGCYSVIGSYELIRFDCPAMFWSSFYYLAYKDQGLYIKFSRALIIKTLKALTNLYVINLNYFSIIRTKGIKVSQVRAGKVVSMKMEEHFYETA